MAEDLTKPNTGGEKNQFFLTLNYNAGVKKKKEGSGYSQLFPGDKLEETGI